MKRFLFRTGIFIVSLALGVGLFDYFSTDEFRSDYMAAIIDKHELADKTAAPKIILAGGSNLAFGIDSQKLEEAIGAPVVNLGLHAGLGLSFMLNELKATVKNGDIVLLSPEYYLANSGAFDLMKNASDYYAPARDYYAHSFFEFFSNPLLDINTYLKNVQNDFKSVLVRPSNDLIVKQNRIEKQRTYTRKAFNKYGDVIEHINFKSRKKLSGGGKMAYKRWEGIKEINQFNNYAKRHNVKVFFLFPTYPDSEFSINKKAISQFELDVRKNLSIEILNTSRDFLYPDSLFYDTVYHLTGKGRKKRTEKLIELIKANELIGSYGQK